MCLSVRTRFNSPPCNPCSALLCPAPRCWPLGLTSLRPCTNFTLGTYGFSVRVLLSLRPATPTPLAVLRRFSPSLLRCPLRRSDASPSPAISVSLLVPYTCGRTYLARMCSPLSASLPLRCSPSESLSEGYVRFHTSASALRPKPPPSPPPPRTANGIQIFLSLLRPFASFAPLSRFHLLPRNSSLLLAFRAFALLLGCLPGAFFSFFLLVLFRFVLHKVVSREVFISSRLIFVSSPFSFKPSFKHDPSHNLICPLVSN